MGEAYMAEKPGFILTTKEKSPIFEAGDKFSVVVLTGIQEEGVAPLNSVSAAIRTELIRKKKGEIIAKELVRMLFPEVKVSFSEHKKPMQR